MPAYLFYGKIRPKANMKNFITNSGAENLKKCLIELIQKSDGLKILAGFFYFSEIRRRYEQER